MENVPTVSQIFWQGKSLERSQFRKQLRIIRFIFVGGVKENPKVPSDLGDSTCSQSPITSVGPSVFQLISSPDYLVENSYSGYSNH